MGQLIMTVAGGVIGGLLGGPLGASIGMSLGGMVGATLFGPTIKGPRLSDLKVTASTYGNVIPKLYGTTRVGGNMIWSDGIEEVKKKSGGKGAPKQETYHYYSTFAMSICEGPIDNILRIWADGKLIYDVSAGSSRTGRTMPQIENFSDIAAFAATIGKVGSYGKYKYRLYNGTEEQLPDSIMETKLGVGNVSAHRGMAYIVFDRMSLEDFGNRVPQLTFEVVKQTKSYLPYLLSEKLEDGTPVKNLAYVVGDPTLGRIYAFNHPGGTPITSVMDAATMKEIQRVPITLKTPSGAREAYIQGEGLYFREIGASNSRPMEIYNTLTMTKIGTLGVSGGSTSGSFNPTTKALQLSGVGPMGYHHAIKSGGRTVRLLIYGIFRDVWCINYGDDTPVFKSVGAFTPGRLLPARETASSSQTLGWRNSSNTLQMEMWEVGADAEGKVLGTKWVQSTNWSKSQQTIVPYPGESFSARNVAYDKTDDTLFVVGVSGGVVCAFKYSYDESTFKWKQKYPTAKLSSASTYRGDTVSGGTYGWLFWSVVGTVSGQLNEIDLATGELVRNDNLPVSSFGGLYYMGASQTWDEGSASVLMYTKTGLSRIMFRTGNAACTLAETVREICNDTNILTDDDIDLTGLDDETFTGYVVDAQSTARDLLKQLGTAFFFEGYESDYKLKFRSRGGSPVVNIPENWAGRGSDGVAVKETMTQELEMPMRTSVSYYDVGRDHQQGTQLAKRTSAPVPTMWSPKELNIDLPMAWTATAGKQCAEKLLKMSWANRVSYGLTLPWRYLKYDPTDVITFTKADGTVFTMRFAEVTIGADFTIAVTGVSERAAAYTSNAVTEPGVAPLQGLPFIYPAKPLVMNTPLLRDVDYDSSNNAVIYLAVDSYGSSFSGATLMIDDGPVEFSPVGYIKSKAVTGFVTNTLPKTSSYEATDDTTILYVRLTEPEATLESATQDDLLTTYANAALVGDEIIQFRDAVAQSDGTWALSGLLRARRGTNDAVNVHVANERFVLLGDTAMTKFYRPPEQYVTTRTFKAVPPSTLAEDATAYPQALDARDLMPYTPENVKITDDGTTVTITAQRRSRVTAPLADSYGVIHYKEGDKLNARIAYSVWAGLGTTDINTPTTATLSGQITLFDSVGVDTTPTITFPLADLGGATKILVKLVERGVVDGTPKWVQFTRMSQGDWNRVEVY